MSGASLLRSGLSGVALGVLATAMLDGQGKATDYPQWRGRSGDGSASGFAEPRTWPERLTRMWRVEVGEGYSTPLVVGDKVFTFSRHREQEVARAIALMSGRTLWRTGYGVMHTPSEPTVAHGSGPKATPLHHSGSMFTVGITGIVSAFDARSGRLRWQTEAPKEVPFFSAAASPTGTGDLVLTHPGNYDPLTAFDRRSGAVRWTTGAGGFFMSPLLVRLDGVSQVVTVTQAGVIGVDAPSGRLLWQYPWTGGRLGGISPVVHDGLVIVSAAQSGVLALRPTRRDGQWSVRVAWETTEMPMYMSTPVVIDDVLYGLSQRNSGQYFAMDTATGEVLWRGAGRDAAHASFVKAGRLLFVLADSGELTVARPSRAGLSPLARYQVAEGATWAQPVIFGNRVLVKDSVYLTLWKVE